MYITSNPDQMTCYSDLQKIVDAVAVLRAQEDDSWSYRIIEIDGGRWYSIEVFDERNEPLGYL